MEKIKQYILEHNSFIITGHEGPDLDTVGSVLALTSFLKRLGKEAVACSAGPFTRTEVMRYEKEFNKIKGFDPNTLPLPFFINDKPVDAAILVDCSSIKRTGYTALPCSFMVIDHHALSEDDSGSGYIDPDSPSTTLLIARLIKDFGYQITTEEANWLLLGFCADTAFFKHLNDGYAGNYLREVADLLDAGASLKETGNNLEALFNLPSRHYLGHLIYHTVSHYAGKLLIVKESRQEKMNFIEKLTWENKLPVNFDEDILRDSDMLYQLLLTVSGVEVVALLKEDERGINVSLRSKNLIDVNSIAYQFGGGGHKKAAGFSSQTKTLKNVEKNLLKSFKPLLDR
ncbi:MAG: DHH family phosphoesterase [Spirochaetaceae bacterium]|nr:DHH family phosphoesterase [Spirochaetaceae bacterium]